MIHSIYTMSIRDYGKFEKSENTKYFKKWYNLLPSFLFIRQITKFFNDFNEVIDAGYKSKLSQEKHRLITYNRILKLSNLYNGIYNILVIKSQNDILAEKEIRLTKSLKIYQDAVENATGIEVNNLEDLKKLQKEIERRTDKYIEIFKKEEKKKETTFIQLVLSVCSLMDVPYNEKMTIFEFSELNKLAIQKAKEHGRDSRNNK